MRHLTVALLLAVAACGDSTGQSTPDAGSEISARCAALWAWDGEACTITDHRPDVNTTCRGIGGWCLDDACRPQCSEDCEPCGGRRVYAPAGGCYCAR